MQESFKIVVETKLTDWFYADQLMKHLKSFGNENKKIMLTLSSEPMAEKKLLDFEKQMKVYNATQAQPVIHINTTFEAMANAIRDAIDDYDYEMQDILDDYLDYCYTNNLISTSDSWKYLRMQLAGTTLDYNIANGVYYDNAERRFRAHEYLGLYKHKSIRAIGKVCARITAIETDDGIECIPEYGDLTEERKRQIIDAMKDGDSHGYNLKTVKHRYFFVDKFYETDFKKMSPGGSMGTKIFDLTQLLGTDNIPDVEEVAKQFKNMFWS